MSKIDVSMLGVPDYFDVEASTDAWRKERGVTECLDYETGLYCRREIKPLSPEAMAIWREVEQALMMEIEEKSEPRTAIAEIDLSRYGWNDISQS